MGAILDWDAIDDAVPEKPVEKKTPARKRPSREELIQRLEADQVAAELDFETAKSAFSNASVDFLEGVIGQAGVDRAKQNYDKARERLETIGLAIIENRVRHTEEMLKDQRIREAAEWERAIAVADERLDSLKQLSRAAASFAEAWKGVQQANERLFNACPLKLDMSAARMNLTEIEISIRCELQRSGVAWAFNHPFILEVTPFDQDMATTPGVIRSWRDQICQWAEEAPKQEH